MTDIIAGLTAGWLAKRQAKSLSEARAKQLAANPELPQKEYQQAREAMLGKDFGTQPAGEACQPCMAADKAARRAQRLELVDKGVNACPEHAPAAARLREDMDQVEHARVAKAVYLKYDADAPADLKRPPPGFLDPSKDELDALLGPSSQDQELGHHLLAPKGTEFRAALYKKDPLVWGENPQPPYDLVFRGSTLAKEDWDNNFAQNANKESSYYERAVRLGNRLADRGQTSNVHVVGHSLGGGMAAAAQGGSGATATTFNAAGLNPKTVARYSQTGLDRLAADADKIAAYRVEGEVLTKTQESGITQFFSHAAPGQRQNVPVADESTSADDRHGMNEMIAAIEKRKEADEAALKACLADKG
ncbi:hypothetical protein ACG04Q_13075 [Roseateles sp. DXS20W]|uniref:DUF2974 domain-containing protein n=1 Tax=Pelomonas lactea TaxID=3299030 RepID=A0ABW7GKY5_9BURK